MKLLSNNHGLHVLIFTLLLVEGVSSNRLRGLAKNKGQNKAQAWGAGCPSGCCIVDGKCTCVPHLCAAALGNRAGPDDCIEWTVQIINKETQSITSTKKYSNCNGDAIPEGNKIPEGTATNDQTTTGPDETAINKATTNDETTVQGEDGGGSQDVGNSENKAGAVGCSYDIPEYGTTFGSRFCQRTCQCQQGLICAHSDQVQGTCMKQVQKGWTALP